ncbi:MAG: AAA family ATPase [Gammaproteobacteria bacterium]
MFEFAAYTLDPENLVLEHRGQHVALRRSCFSLLVCLVCNRHRVVRKEELDLSDQALKTSIKEIRSVFGDDGRGQRFIKTRHGIGYQFIAAVREQGTKRSNGTPESSALAPARVMAAPPSAPQIVGRDRQLETLARLHARSLSGKRTIVFMPGEPGIGKTACVDAFLDSLVDEDDALVLRGQCVETHGAEEAFMPWMEAMEQLGRLSSPVVGVELIERLAPSWLAHMPWLANASPFTGSPAVIQRSNRVRMMRELAVALETSSEDRPVVLALEDLHWSDPSTLDALSFFARRRYAARVLVICTYRPTGYGPDIPRVTSIHQELAQYDACESLDIPLLTSASVTEHVDRHYPGLPGSLCRDLHRSTDGNPLFLVCLLSHLESLGFVRREAGNSTLRLPEGMKLEEVSPDSVHAVVTDLFERLEPLERQLIEVASLIGVEFSSTLVAAGMSLDVELAEGTLESLARRHQFIRAKGQQEWPDGTAVQVFEFTHALIKDVVLKRITAARRQKHHARIADRLEAGFGDQTQDIASELARHFEAAKSWQSCVSYSRLAAHNALRRFAPAEAVRHLKRALRGLEHLPKDVSRQRTELELLAELAPSVSALEGYASTEAKRVYRRAEELAEELGEDSVEFDLSRARLGMEFLQGNLRASKRIGERLVSMASTDTQRPLLHAEACARLGTVLWHQGEIRSGLALFLAGSNRHPTGEHLAHAMRLGHDPVVVNLVYTGWSHWAAGKSVQARTALDKAAELVRELEHPATSCVGLGLIAVVQQLLDDVGIDETLSTCAAIAEVHGMVHWQAVANILAAWLSIDAGTARASSLSDLRQATTDYESTGAMLLLPYYLSLLSRAELRVGKIADASQTIARALSIVSSTGENWCLPELTRIQAEVEYRAHPSRDMSGAKQAIRRSIRAAKRLGVRQWELRSAHTLAELNEGSD